MNLSSIVLTAALSLCQADGIVIRDLDLGNYWYGPHIFVEDLSGKVVLFAYWGSDPASVAVTRQLIQICDKYRDKPFHLVAAHIQRKEKAEVIAFVQKLGLAKDNPNFTITRFGSHPKIPSPKFTPYYAVFDYRGRLVHQGPGGGNEDREFEMLDHWIAPLVAKVPALYLGEAPFAELGAVAAKVEALHDLPASIKTVEDALAATDTSPKRRAEAERIHAAIVGYRDRKLAHIKAAYELDPESVLPALRALGGQLGGTKLGATVAREVDKVKKSKVLAHARAWHKAYARIDKKLARLRPCAQGARARSGFDAACQACRAANASAIKRIVADLDKLVEHYPDLVLLGKKAKDRRSTLTSPGRRRH